MVMCVYGVRNGTQTVGDFVMINAMMIQLYQPLNLMGMLYREIKQAVIDIELMFSVIAKDAEIKDVPGAPPLAGAARARSSSRTSRSATIRRGRSCATCRSRCRPAARLPSSGLPAPASRPSRGCCSASTMFVGPHPDRRSGYPRRSRRNRCAQSIGMVPQDTVLFNDTIRYNIRYGRWDATDAEVEQAARHAHIDTFIRLAPKGYDTEVGERGLKLSGGEKQRVAIARTILKAPPILLLDEATSALDSHTEKDIQDALDEMSQGRTTLVIAHRLSTIVAADEIIVLAHGEVAERGTHQQLLAKGGLYASMWNRQREAEAAREKLAEVEDEGSSRAPVAGHCR